MIRRILYWIAAASITAFATVTAFAMALTAGAGVAYAAPPQTAPRGATTHMLAADDLPTIIGNITTWVTGLLIGVATLFLTIGGIRYLAAGGDPTEIEKAKSALKSALVGYALAVLAPILLAVVQGWIGG
jgi:hypothetical protein